MCAASLPTTMGVVAGFLVQNTLKHLLQFGNVTNYLGYSALTDFFPTMNLKPNPNCIDCNCQIRQQEILNRPKIEKAVEVEEEKPVHEDNEWGISLLDESVADNSRVQVAEGVTLAYTLPSQENNVNESNANENVSLEDLMAQMKSI